MGHIATLYMRLQHLYNRDHKAFRALLRHPERGEDEQDICLIIVQMEAYRRTIFHLLNEKRPKV